MNRGMYKEGKGNVKIITPEDNYYVVVRVKEDDIVELLDVYQGPTDGKKLVKRARRGFIALGLAAVVALYAVTLAKPLQYIGRAANVGMDVGGSIANLSKEVVDRIFDRMGLEDKLNELESMPELPDETFQKFKQAYGEQHKLINLAGRLRTDYDSFSNEMNRALRETPVGKVEDTQIYSLSERVYNKSQKLLTGRDVSNPIYRYNFDMVRQKKKQLGDTIKEIEISLGKALDENDIRKSIEFMEDYMAVDVAQKELVKIVKEKGISKIMQEEIDRIDADLKKELGGDYMKYVEAFRKKRKVDLGFWLPVAGGVAAAGLAHSYVLRPVADYAVGPVARIKQKRTRRNFMKSLIGKYNAEQKGQEGAENDQGPKDL